MADTSPFTPRLLPNTSRIVSVDMEYNSDPSSTNNNAGPPGEGGLDMDIMHDFGEGVGVDMRDFPVHVGDDEGEAMNDGMINKDASAIDHLNATPITPHPSSSVTSNGIHEPPSSTGVDIDNMFQAETGLDDEDDDDDDPEATPHAKRPRNQADVPGGFTYVDKDGESGRRKIRIEYIADKSRRHITFSKRKSGIMKKAYELSILTGTQVLLLVVSETGLVYTFTTTKLQPLVQKPEGKNLIQACLNAPDGFGPDGLPLTGPVHATKAKNGGLAIRPHKLTASASAALAASAQAASQNQARDEDHAPSSQQADAAAAVGQGTPVSARPKKRMPSGKGKKAAAAAAAEAAAANQNNAAELIPPVPSIPDIHRQSSPHQPPNTMMPGQLASPMSGGYHIPPEYHHHASPTAPTFGYGGGPGDYHQGYYGSSPGQPHPYGGHLGVPPPGPHMYQDGRDRRMMVDSQGRSIGMGM